MKNETYESRKHHSELIRIVESGQNVYAAVYAGYVIGIFRTESEAKKDLRTEAIKIWGEKDYKKHTSTIF